MIEIIYNILAIGKRSGYEMSIFVKKTIKLRALVEYKVINRVLMIYYAKIYLIHMHSLNYKYIIDGINVPTVIDYWQ